MKAKVNQRQIGKIKKIIVVLLCITCLSVFLVLGMGCKGSKIDEPTVSKPAGLKQASKNSKIDKPAINEDEARQISRIIRDLYSSYLNQNKKKAVSLFLPRTRKTAEMLVAKNIELASENKKTAARRSGGLILRQEKKLWPENYAKTMTHEELRRFVALEKEYKKVVVAVAETLDGKLNKIFCIQKNNQFYLLP